MATFDLTSRIGRYRARKAGMDVPKRKPGKPAKDFWSQVKKTNGCWLWTGKISRDGYGIYCAHGTYFKSHRYVLEFFRGLQIKNKVVMHSCDRPACCNPDHLAVGTHADNQKDKFQKNRQAKGELNGSSVLTKDQVLEMRAKYKPRLYTYEMLAQEYGISKDTAQKAVRGIYWKHI